MRERQLPRHLRKTDLKIAYLSQQQLRSFNFPYQLGYFTGHNSDPSSSSTSTTNNDANTNNNTSSTNTTTNNSNSGSGSMQENKGRFETPSDADTASIPVFPGKIYICDTVLLLYVIYIHMLCYTYTVLYYSTCDYTTHTVFMYYHSILLLHM